MNPEKTFDEVSHFITESRDMLKQGVMVELAGLEKSIMKLCEETLMLSQDDRILYADKLQQLLADLELLGEELAAQRDLVAEEIRGLSHHKKASVAYRIADASDGGAGDEEK